MTDESENADRRRLLAVASLAGGAVLAGATGGAGVAEVTGGERARALGERRVPFDGDRQAGVLAPYAAHGWCAAFDLEPGVSAARLAGTLRAWTAAARRLTDGRPVSGDDAVAAGYGPASLTVTAGFGASLLRRIGAPVPAELAPMPPYHGDEQGARHRVLRTRPGEAEPRRRAGERCRRPRTAGVPALQRRRGHPAQGGLLLRRLPERRRARRGPAVHGLPGRPAEGVHPDPAAAVRRRRPEPVPAARVQRAVRRAARLPAGPLPRPGPDGDPVVNMPMPMGDPPAPLSWGRALTTWRFAPVTTAVLAAVLALYLAAVVVARRRGERRTSARTACFTAGQGVVAVAIMGSPGVYGVGGQVRVPM